MRVRISPRRSESLLSRRRERIYSPLAKIPPQRKAASSPTARKYSLLFGGAYAPNDAIYRKRYAFTEIIMPYNFYFSRARRQNQLSTVSYSLTRRFDQERRISLAEVLLFLLPLAFFVFYIKPRLPPPLPRHLLRLPQALLRAAFPSP